MSSTGASVKRVVYESGPEARGFWPRLWMRQSLRPVSVSPPRSIPSRKSQPGFQGVGDGSGSQCSLPCLCPRPPSIHLQSRVRANALRHASRSTPRSHPSPTHLPQTGRYPAGPSRRGGRRGRGSASGSWELARRSQPAGFTVVMNSSPRNARTLRANPKIWPRPPRRDRLRPHAIIQYLSRLGSGEPPGLQTHRLVSTTSVDERSVLATSPTQHPPVPGKGGELAKCVGDAGVRDKRRGGPCRHVAPPPRHRQPRIPRDRASLVVRVLLLQDGPAVISDRLRVTAEVALPARGPRDKHYSTAPCCASMFTLVAGQQKRFSLAPLRVAQPFRIQPHPQRLALLGEGIMPGPAESG